MNTVDVKKVFYFQSATVPGKQYETILYTNGTASCNCPSWTKRRARQCKHTLQVAPPNVLPAPEPLTKERERRLRLDTRTMTPIRPPEPVLTTRKFDFSL